MSEPGKRSFGEDLAPTFSLFVQGIEIQTDITKYIKSVEFESTIEMADMIDVSVYNPNFAMSDEKNFMNCKVFQPGNEMELWIGYGQADHYIGRAILQKHLPVFPADDLPILKVKGYDKSFLMMKAAGDLQGAQANKIKLVQPRPADANDNQGKNWSNLRHSDVVTQVAKKYSFRPDVDQTAIVDTIVQKKGTVDFDYVKTLANLNDKEFWVDYSPEFKSWVLHWKSPNDSASPEYDFKYNAGQKTTLLDCELEYGITEPITNLLVLAWDAVGERWVSVVEVEDAESEDPIFKPGKEIAILEEIESPTQFRLSASGVAMDIISQLPCKDPNAIAKFAHRWFLERKNNFLTANARVVGVETLAARQVHVLSGLGKRIDGPFYFISVKHKLDDSSGYFCDITARKIVE